MTNGLVTLLLGLLLSACSDIEVRPAPIDDFTAGNYKYYRWRSEPLENSTNSRDPAYLMDPIMRREVNTVLASKGYVLDPEQAQFSVDYIYASGLRIGEREVQVPGTTDSPPATANRQVDQAVIDNTYALGGVKETSNISVQINDVQRKQVVWQVIITRIVENVNDIDLGELQKSLQEGVRKGLGILPEAN